MKSYLAKNTCLMRPVLIIFMLILSEFSYAQVSALDVKTVSGRTHFSHTQVPENIVSQLPLSPLFTYQWEMSDRPLDGFVEIPGATGSEYTFSSSLATTTYFRRRFSIIIPPFVVLLGVSRPVKIKVVSENWEDRNYLREHDVLVPGISNWNEADLLPIGDRLEKTIYSDGLDRTIQTVVREVGTPENEQSGGLWSDLVEVNEYDEMGRETKDYLSFTTTQQSGKFKEEAVGALEQFYLTSLNETSPYSSISYDNSPVQRIINIKSSGTSWASGNGSSSTFSLNGHQTVDPVPFFSMGYGESDIPNFIGFFLPNKVFSNTVVDEGGTTTVEYVDSDGRLIFVKTKVDENTTDPINGWICTYSVYDKMGRLRYRFQPEAVKWLSQNEWDFGRPGGAEVLANLCFKYLYDEKYRMVEKKAPGAEPIYMLYDLRNRLAFTQDGNQRAKSPQEWAAHIYDNLDRHQVSTLYYSNMTRTQMQQELNTAYETISMFVPDPESQLVNLEVNLRNTSIPLYAAQNSITFKDGFESGINDAFEAVVEPGNIVPEINISYARLNNVVSEADLGNSSVCTILKQSFYDDYGFSDAESFNSGFGNPLAGMSGDPIAPGKRNRGMLTGMKVRVLGTSDFLLTTLFHDEKGRLIQAASENIKGGNDITTFQYSFDSKLLSTSSRHTVPGTGYSKFDIVTKNIYDKLGRLISLEKKYGDNPFREIANYSYDAFGRLRTKKLSPGYTGTGEDELEILNYSYNIHSEITGINKAYALKEDPSYSRRQHFFGFYLGFDNRDGFFDKSELSGRVGGVVWNSQGDDVQRKFEFEYDKAGRLLNADYKEKESPTAVWANNKMDFSTTGNNGVIQYDLNGNLLSLVHKGVVVGETSPVEVDNLQYAYSSFSNKLLSVTDIVSSQSHNGKMGDFSDGDNGSTPDYVYDENGNVIIDLNKNITDQLGASGIKYNYLDKPEEIKIEGKGVVQIVYDADGSKLQRKFTPVAGPSVVISYIGQYVYNGDDLQYIGFEEGRIRIVEPVSEANEYDFVSLQGNIDLPGGRQGAFDYFIRDYQANVRMVITRQSHVGGSTCTMETARSALEEATFGQVNEDGTPSADNEVQARFAVSGIPGQSTGNGWQHPDIGAYVSRIGNLSGAKLGPNTLLKVMSGDEISATSIYYYQNPVTNTAAPSGLLNNFISAFTDVIAGSGSATGMVKDGVAGLGTVLGANPALATALAPDANNASGSAPKAYMTILFFDERMNFLEDHTETVRVSQSGNGAAPLVLAEIEAPRNGYAYVYLSNESDEHVYFDNFQVVHERGHILEENHYYAYGLRIEGISSRKLADSREGNTRNKYLYNDKELFEDGGLDWYDYGFRNYDAQIGRFMQLDPLTDEYPYLTPYQYAGCEPIANVDLDGLEPMSTIGSELAEVVVVHKVAKAGTGFWKGAGRFLGGVFNGVKETVMFTVNAFNPDPAHNSLVQVGQFVGALVTDPAGTIDAIKTSISETDWSDPAVYGNLVGSLITPGSVVKGVKFVAKASAAAKVSKAARLARAERAAARKGKSFASDGGEFVDDFHTNRSVDQPLGGEAKNGSTAANRLGQQMHKDYKAGDVLDGVRMKEFLLPSRKKIDFIDFENKIIYELKPNNPRAIKQGYKQLEIYKQEVEKIYGTGFKTVLDKY